MGGFLVHRSLRASTDCFLCILALSVRFYKGAGICRLDVLRATVAGFTSSSVPKFLGEWPVRYFWKWILSSTVNKKKKKSPVLKIYSKVIQNIKILAKIFTINLRFLDSKSLRFYVIGLVGFVKFCSIWCLNQSSLNAKKLWVKHLHITLRKITKKFLETKSPWLLWVVNTAWYALERFAICWLTPCIKY